MAVQTADRSEWFGAERARAWAIVLGVMSAIALAGLVIATRSGTVPDPWGRPMAPDFSSFWVASRLALSGHAAGAWDSVQHWRAQRGYFPVEAGYLDDYYGFFYPPPFLALLLPLGMLPYGAAIWVWIGGTGAAYLVALRRLAGNWPVVLAGASYPGFLINAEHGQNGALSAALLAGGAMWLDRRPRLAGACLGIMVVKPHVALLIVPALLAARRFRAVAFMGIGAGVLCLVSWGVLGAESWRGFLGDGPVAMRVLEDGLVGHAKMVSVFAGARLLGAGIGTAWVVQGVVGAGVLLVVIGVARRRPGGFAEMAVVCAAVCLATPFLLDYDMMIVSVPLAWLVCRARVGGFRGVEKAVAFAVFVLPFFARMVATGVGVPIAPVMLAALLWMIVARIGAVTGPLGQS